MKLELDTVGDLVAWLRQHDDELADSLASEVESDWCWEEAVQWAKEKKISPQLRDEFARDLIETGDAKHLYKHQFYLGHRDDVLEALIKTGSAECLYRHQRLLGHRDDVLAALIATDDLEYLCRHQRFVGYRKQIQVIIEKW